MNGLSFVLALGAVVFPVAWLVAVTSLVGMTLVRRLSPVARAESAAWLAVAPTLTAIGLVVAVSAPSVLYGLGLGADHCVGHEHHPHLCAWHGAMLPAWLAAVGAASWALFAVRWFQVTIGLVRTEHLGAALAALGRPRDGFLLVPAMVPVCHVVGVVHPRVFVSEAVVGRLDPGGLCAVVAHERAHLDRSDPRWSALLALAATVAPPASRWVTIWREATEEAADDVAAIQTSGATVARALVTVARMRLDAAPGFAFGATGLERRVTRLLVDRVAPRPSRTLLGAVVMTLSISSLVALEHERVHHAAEEGWEWVVGD